MPNFMTGLAEGFDPQTFASILTKKQQQKKEQQAIEAQNNSLAQLLSGKDLPAEDKAKLYSKLGNENQQAYNLFLKMNEKQIPQFKDVKQLPTGEFVGLNPLTGRMEKLPSTFNPIAEAPKNITKPTDEFVIVQNPTTGLPEYAKDTKGDLVPNIQFKKPIVKEEKIGKSYIKGDQRVQEIEKYENGQYVGKEIRTKDAKDSSGDIATEVYEDIKSESSDLEKMKTEIENVDKKAYFDTVDNVWKIKPSTAKDVAGVPVADYKKNLETTYKSKAESLVKMGKELLDEKGKTFYKNVYNQLGGKNPVPEEFMGAMAEAFTKGDLGKGKQAHANLKALKAIYSGTYGRTR